MATRASAKAIVPVLRTADKNFDDAFEKLVRRREDGQEDVLKAVRRIIDRVRSGGDEELRACIKKYDGASLDEFEVTRREFENAGEAIDPADRASLGKAAMRVRGFHRKRPRAQARQMTARYCLNRSERLKIHAARRFRQLVVTKIRAETGFHTP